MAAPLSRSVHIAHAVRSLEVGGLENGVVNLINALQDGFRHTVICLETLGRLRRRLPENVAMLTPGPGVARSPLTCVRLAGVSGVSNRMSCTPATGPRLISSPEPG
jgi:hypothetical protein